MHYLSSPAGCHECGRGTQWAQSDPVDETDTSPLWNTAVITQTTRFRITRSNSFQQQGKKYVGLVKLYLYVDIAYASVNSARHGF